MDLINKKRFILFIALILSLTESFTQSLSTSIGTDIPFQYYVGINKELKSFDFSLRTGVLVPPYSNAIIKLLEGLGTDEVYIDLLDVAYKSGWMNSIGTYFKFGSTRTWFIGTELRVDYLTASDTPIDLVEAATGFKIGSLNANNRNLNLKLNLTMVAFGFRFGKKFSLGHTEKHYLKTELSIYKHIYTQSSLFGNEHNLEQINQELDKLLWHDVFKPYGYLGGLGIAYSFIF